MIQNEAARQVRISVSTARGAKSLSPAITEHLKRYARADHAGLRRLAVRSKPHADLLISFPAAAVAMARNHGPMLSRAAALEAVAHGESLARVAALLDLAPWLRKLPPEAFHGPLPQSTTPSTPQFSRWILNLAPLDWRHNQFWISQVERARTFGGEKFATWIAHRLPHSPLGNKELPSTAFRLLAAYASAQGRQEACRRPWTPQIGLSAAMTEARIWLAEQLLEHQAKARRGEGPRAFDVMDGHHFVRLETYRDLYEDGRIMQHCVASYAELAAFDVSRLYSVQRGGARVATVEIIAKLGGSTEPEVRQISGVKNARAPAETMTAVYRWVTANTSRPRFHFRPGTDPILQKAWRDFWAPYTAQFGACEAITDPMTRNRAQKTLLSLQILSETFRVA